MTWTLPNKLTMLRIILVPFFVAALLIQNGEVSALRMTALVLFLIASLTDLLDGKIARKYNLVTNFGKFMDPLADKLLVCSALICLVQLGQLPAWVVIIIISREFIISGFRLVAADQGVVIAASMWGKSKTVSQMISIVLLILNLKQPPFPILTAISVPVMTILTIVSLLDYLMKNKQVLEEKH
ncbi:MAG: CDP-diacylglycerol--glycerol-3-phosphate 3-phosphatidyltransferase [Stomatobaculum sp.]|nr:CDP-diacylglycerol--glycerol-3-phosphate 3-phosphatidyltransferase [Stomatobaculum sp.]